MKGWTTKETIDYTGVTTDAPKPPPEGLYRARMKSANPQPTAKGDPMIKLTVGLFENEEGEAVKRDVIDNMTLSQKAAFRILILAEALGIEPLSATDIETTEAFCKEVVEAGKDGFWVRVAHENYTKKGKDPDHLGDPDYPNDWAVGCKIARYLTEDEVKKSKDSSKSNGASTANTGAAAPRRPRAPAPAVS